MVHGLGEMRPSDNKLLNYYFNNSSRYYRRGLTLCCIAIAFNMRVVGKTITWDNCMLIYNINEFEILHYII